MTPAYRASSGIESEIARESHVFAECARAAPPVTLLHVFPSFAIGGQQTRFATVANWLGRGFRHKLVSLDAQCEALALLDPALDVVMLTALQGSANSAGRLGQIAKAVASTGADALLTYNWGAIEWALANQFGRRRPHIHLEDGFGPEEVNRQKGRRVLLRRLVLRRSTVVVPSRRLVEIATGTWRLPPQRVRYIPNGIDPARFDAISRTGAPYFERRDKECVIGSFSPLRPEKNIARLLDAVVRLGSLPVPVRLVVCGDGPEAVALKRRTTDLGIAGQVTFTGHVSKPETVMGAFDLFAITSDTEQMPYAVLEAMAARLPVLATDVGDIAAMVSLENRPFVISRQNSAGLASALAALCADPGLRRSIGEANRRRVEQAFGIRPMVEAFGRVIAAAVEGHQRSPLTGHSTEKSRNP